MPAQEIVDEVIGSGSPKVGGVLRRGMIEESIQVKSGSTHATRDNKQGIEDEEIRENSGGRRDRVLKESTKKLLEKIDNGDDDEDGEESGDPDDVGLIDEKKPVKEAKAEVKDDKEAKPDPKADDKKEEVKDEKTSEVDELRADIGRLSETNRKLVEDLESEKKRPRHEMNERMQALDEIERNYLDDSITSVRKLIGIVIGAKHDSKEVDEELSGLYTDLTSKELNVPLESIHKVTREAARTRQQLARDKRERLAETEASKKQETEGEDSRKTQQAAEYITKEFFSSKSSDGASFQDKYPLLMGFAEDLDGLKPEVLLWKVLERESKAGNIRPSTDEKMLHQAAQMVETHYQGLASKFDQAKPKQTDTTKQGDSKPNADTESKEQRQSNGTRTITNANASVAPATTPAKKQTENKTQEERPKFKSKKEAQDWALRHIPE